MKNSIGSAIIIMFVMVFLFSAQGFSASYNSTYPSLPTGWNGSYGSEIDPQLVLIIVMGIVFAMFYINKHSHVLLKK